MVLIFSLGAGLTNVLGRMVKNERQGWALFAAMGVLFLVGVTTAYWAEAQGNPAFAQFHVDQSATRAASGRQHGRQGSTFGIASSALFATVTTDASCGAVNTMHDSLTPIGGMVPLVNIQLGEVIFGGVGSGLYGMIAFAIVAMFVAGPHGRADAGISRQEARGQGGQDDDPGAVVAAAVDPRFHRARGGAAGGPRRSANAGPHGFSEILYAFTSATGNNGSAFAGITANTLFYNVTLGFAMLIGRFVFVVPVLAVAGSLAQKKLVAPSAGTFPTTGPLFVGLLVGVILIFGGLTYFPARLARPVVEQVAMNQARCSRPHLEAGQENLT